MLHAQAMCRDYYTLEFMDRSVDTSPIAPALAAFFDNVLDRSVAQLNFKVRCALVLLPRFLFLTCQHARCHSSRYASRCIKQSSTVLVVSNGTLITQYVSLAWKLRLQRHQTQSHVATKSSAEPDMQTLQLRSLARTLRLIINQAKFLVLQQIILVLSLC